MPEIIIICGNIGTGKTEESKKYSDTHLIIEFDKLEQKARTGLEYLQLVKFPIEKELKKEGNVLVDGNLMSIDSRRFFIQLGKH